MVPERLERKRGEDWKFKIRWSTVDEADIKTPVDLNLWTLTADFSAGFGKPVLKHGTVTKLDAAEGIMLVSLAGADTEEMPNFVSFDVKAVSTADASVRYPVQLVEVTVQNRITV